MDIGFRPLGRDDLPLVHAWLSREHVASWWGGAPTFAEVEAEYLPGIAGSEPVELFAILGDGAPIGVIQTYRVADHPEAWPFDVGPGAAGVDLYIGEPELIGRGLGPDVLRRFVAEVVFADPETTACVADPDVGNRASIRAFEKAGFTTVGTMEVDGKVERVLRLER
jgi:aminoglycoside 6'-N-acetyltransferase